MTLPVSGPISVSMIEQELILPVASSLGLGAASVRSLAGGLSGAVAFSDLYGKTNAAPTYDIYYGISTVASATAADILPLTMSTISALPYLFSLNSGLNQYMYWASPKSLGAVEFYDIDSFFTGGWDGAHNDPYSLPGPITITINSILYYVYRTDFSNLGASNWEARIDLNPNY